MKSCTCSLDCAMADISEDALKYSCPAEFESHLQSYDLKTKTKFVVLKSYILFGKTDKYNKIELAESNEGKPHPHAETAQMS